MGLADITADAVLKAIAEYDALGRKAFLDTYGFRLTSSYALAHDDRTYDPKAVCCAAHKYATGRLPSDSELSGGRADIEKRLGELGFEVRSTPSIPWAWDELILACDLLVKNNWVPLDTSRPEAAALSDLLQRLPLHDPKSRPENFRSTNSVRRKMVNIRDRREDHKDKKSNGGSRDAEIMWAFLDEPERMRNAAENIRRGVRSGELTGLPAFEEEADEDISAPEGRLLIRRHYARERDRGLRKKKIDRTRAKGRPIACEACGFDFGATYGPRGKDYIEVHHVVPLHHIGESVTRLEDLALLCANCHRMIHVSRPWLTVDELRALLDR